MHTGLLHAGPTSACLGQPQMVLGSLQAAEAAKAPRNSGRRAVSATAATAVAFAAAAPAYVAARGRAPAEAAEPEDETRHQSQYPTAQDLERDEVLLVRLSVCAPWRRLEHT